jgi:hypothetical protein
MLAGLWDAAGSTVSNIFNVGTGGVGSAISNVWKGITSGVTNFTSNFFPASQKVSTISNVTAPAGATPNAGYRSGVLPQMASMADKYVATGPTGTYTPSTMDLAKLSADQYVNVQPKVLGASISKPGGLQDVIDNVFAGMQSATENIGTFKTLADSLAGLFIKHKPIVEGPDGTVVTNVSPPTDMSSSVGTYMANMNQVVSDMVKGLFSLGYSGPQGAQPTVPVQGEFAKTATSYSGLLIVAALVVGLIWFLKRK